MLTNFKPQAMAPPPPVQTFGDSEFYGMDARHRPDLAAPGTCQIAENFNLEHGSLISRAGLQGQLSALMGGPIYALTEYRNGSSGTARLIFAAKESGFGTYGRLWRMDLGASSATEILNGAARFEFPSGGSTVRLAYDGVQNLYGVDGTNAPFWYDGTSAGTLSNLAAPTTAPTVTASAVTLSTLPYANWEVDSTSGANTNLCTNPFFVGGDASGTNLGDYWKVTAGQVRTYTNGDYSELPVLNGGTGRWARMDNGAPAGTGGNTIRLCLDAAKSSPYVANGYAINSKWPQNASDRRYCTRFKVSFYITAIDSDVLPVTGYLKFFGGTLGAVDPDNIPLAEYSFTATPATRGVSQLVQEFIDLDGDFSKDITSVTFELSADPASPVDTGGPYVSNFDIRAVHPSWDKPSSPLSGTGFIPLDLTNPFSMSGLCIATNFGTPLSLTGNDKVAFSLSTHATFVPAPQLQVKFSNGTNVWTSPTVELTDSIVVDIAEMPAALKASISNLALVFTSNPVISGVTTGTRTPAGTRCAFYLNSLVSPGNLSAGGSYFYGYSDFIPRGSLYDAGGIESPFSPLSIPIVQTVAQGRSTVVLPAAASGATYRLIWRIGGGLTENHLVAMVPVASSTSLPASTAITSGNLKWYWDHTTRTFTDSVPDTDLLASPVLLAGRSNPVTGASVVTLHGGRLWLAKGATIYASWPLINGISPSVEGVYFSDAYDPAASDAYLKGATFDVPGLGQGEGVQAFSKETPDVLSQIIGNVLLAYFRDGVRIITGDGSPQNPFGQRPAARSSSIGLAAPLAVAETGQNAFYLSGNGIYEFHTDGPVYRSEVLETLVSAAAVASDAAYKTSVFLYHDLRLIAFTPDVGGGVCAVASIYDSRYIGKGTAWTRWRLPKRGGTQIGATSAVSTGLSGTVPALYVGGTDGQVYLYGGDADKLTPSGAAVGIETKLTTRRYGQNDGGTGRYIITQVINAKMDTESDDTSGQDATLYIRNERGQAASRGYKFAYGVSAREIRIIPAPRGTGNQIESVASVLKRFRVRAAHLQVVGTQAIRQ